MKSTWYLLNFQIKITYITTKSKIFNFKRNLIFKLSFYGYENVEIKDRLKIILNYCEKNSYIIYYDMSIYDTDGKIIKNFSSNYSLKSLIIKFLKSLFKNTKNF